MKNPQNILISGASSGIGRSLAIAYSSPGVNLFLCARNEEKLELVKKICVQFGANVLIESFDISDEKAVVDFVAKIEEKYQIDLVISNAGVAGGKVGSDEDFPLVQKILTTNFSAAVHLVSEVSKKMKLRKAGQIAFVSSLASFCGIASSPAYGASKAALRIYAKSLRANLCCFGIGVSVICPGYVESAMTKENDFWMPFLLSSERAAQIIKHGLSKNKSCIAFPFITYFLVWLGALFFNVASDFIFYRIAKKQLNKNLKNHV